MPNVYSGTILSDTAAPLENVEVKTRYVNISNQSILTTTKTGKDGTWRVSLPDGIDISTVTITFVKSGSSSITIKNPQPTGTYTFPPPQIDPNRGGVLDLKAGFASGKYLISSLDPYDQGLLDYELANIMKFVTTYPTKTAIVIKASESQITNYDREPSASNGTANPNFEKKLEQKVLSGYRADNLSTYIKKYFTDNGQPAPNTQKDLLVSGPPQPSPFPERGTPQYQEVLNKYKQFQYVTVNAVFTGPPCVPTSFSSSENGNITFFKPPGATTLTIDAFDLPDRFGFSTQGTNAITYTDTYYQNASAPGSVTSWSFVIYLATLRTPTPPGITPFTLPITGDSPNGNLRQSLIDDWFKGFNGVEDRVYGGLIASQIIQWNQDYAASLVPSDRGATRNIVRGFKATDYNSHINFCLNNVPKVVGSTNLVYGYPITRGDLVYNLRTVPNNGTFIVSYIKGNYNGSSFWSYKMCP